MPSTNATENHGLNYISANRFYVEMEESSSISACFNECSGLSVSIDYDTYFEGGVNNQQRIILGNTKFSEVTLKRGITNDATFWEWASRMLTQFKPDTSSPQRRNINILLFNQAGETIQCWTLIGAVPVGWKAPALRADENAVAIEELSLAFEGLKVEVNANPGGNGTALGGGATLHQKGREAGSGFFLSS